jgi:hypothetical protein
VALWRSLPAPNRRWIVLNALLVSALINLVVNAALAWLGVRGADVPLMGVPLLETSTIVDTVGTFFILPLLTCLLCTSAVWYERRNRELPSLDWTRDSHPWLAAPPWSRLGRGLRLGTLVTLLLAPPAVILLVATDFGGISTGQFVLYKAILGVALGALVTPPIALWAMSDPLGDEISP